MGGWNRVKLQETPPVDAKCAEPIRLPVGGIAVDIGLRVAASALHATELGVGVYANDLVNANTTAFDPATPIFAGLPASLIAAGSFPAPMGAGTPPWLSVGSGTELAATQTQVGQEPVVNTGVPTDVAPSGTGFFVVGTPAGPAYTRDGAFSVGGSGLLTSAQGYPVYSAAGLPIRVPPGAAEVSIDASGRVLAGGQYVATLAVATFPNPSGLLSIGQNLFSVGQSQQASAGPASISSPQPGSLRTGALLGSGTDVSAALVGLIQMERSFQLDAKAVTDASQMLNWAASLG